jgi:D-alanyl-D-alanine carboxypeptidase
MKIFNNASNLNFVASPGTSEHQSGLVLDVSTLQYGLIQDFQYSKEFEILKNNCMNYGFIIRYPKNKENITGYYFEPWHLRFVGKDIAKYIMMNNLTLEEYIFKNIEL